MRRCGGRWAVRYCTGAFAWNEGALDLLRRECLQLEDTIDEWGEPVLEQGSRILFECPSDLDTYSDEETDVEPLVKRARTMSVVSPALVPIDGLWLDRKSLAACKEHAAGTSDHLDAS